jgi:hypothetical protein
VLSAAVATVERKDRVASTLMKNFEVYMIVIWVVWWCASILGLSCRCKSPNTVVLNVESVCYRIFNRRSKIENDPLRCPEIQESRK